MRLKQQHKLQHLLANHSVVMKQTLTTKISAKISVDNVSRSMLTWFSEYVRACFMLVWFVEGLVAANLVSFMVYEVISILKLQFAED